MSVSLVPGSRDDTWVSHDGLPLFGRSSISSGPPRAWVVVVHGLKDHSGRYGPLAERLNREGIGVSALDLRGHGRSGGPRAHVRSFDDYLSDLAAYVGLVQAAHPGVPLFLFGHSMGGQIAVRRLLRQPEAFRGAILSGPALAAARPVSGGARAVTKFLAAVVPRARILGLDDHDFSRDPSTLRENAADPLIFHGKATARLASGLLEGIEQLGAQFGSLRTPFLVLHGEQDRLTGIGGSRELVERASSEDKTLKVYPGLFHDLLHEPERGTVMDDLANWLTRRAG